MAGPKIPYPPSPTDVPEDLTEYAPSYRSQQNLLLAGLFVFLLFYVGLIALCVLLGTYCAVTLNVVPAAKLAGIVVCGLAFLFLVKGFFKRHPVEKEMHIEITEEDQPVLFGFIEQLCEELDAPLPNKVFVSPEVNAAVMPRTTLINLFVEPKKDLLIGLGLVNSVNLSEFKAIMAHEFGHFCQTGFTASYGYVVGRIIYDLVEGEDWFDRIVNWCKRQDNAVSAVGYFVGAFLWAGRKILEAAYNAFTLQRLTVSREREFNADLVAVSVAGSDAMTHGLLRVEFGHLCLMQTHDDLALAADHKLYTRDLYHHQDRAGRVVRKEKKDPKLGLPPHLDGPLAGKDVRVFDREQEEVGEDDVPEMYRTHPSNADREENAKEQFVPAVVDHRSAWVLFTEAADLRERVTYKFYRMVLRIKKNTELAPPEEVQQFIDDEHTETTYDPKYQGIYDGRPLDPGDIPELNKLIRETPWTADRIEKVFEKLYEGAGGKNEDYQDLKKEKATLENTPGKPGRRIQKKINKLQDEIDHIWDWFKSLDRRVYLCHVQMAAAVNADWRDELVERYRFGLEIQRFYMESEHHAEKSFFFARVLFSLDDPHPEFVAEVMQILRQAWRALKKIVQDARDINMPAMKNFEEGERLADFILEGKMVPEPPLSYVKSAWAQKLVDQLRDVRRRCGRLHWKSVGGILALQEKIAAAWKEKNAPVEAEVVAVPAEIVEAVEAVEVVDATLPTMVAIIDAEVAIDAEVVQEFVTAEPVAEVPAVRPAIPPPPSSGRPRPSAAPASRIEPLEKPAPVPAAVAPPPSPPPPRSTPPAVPVPAPRVEPPAEPSLEHMNETALAPPLASVPLSWIGPPAERRPIPQAAVEPRPMPAAQDLTEELPPVVVSPVSPPAAGLPPEPEPEPVAVSQPPVPEPVTASQPTEPVSTPSLPDDPVATILALDAAGPAPSPVVSEPALDVGADPAMERTADTLLHDVVANGQAEPADPLATAPEPAAVVADGPPTSVPAPVPALPPDPVRPPAETSKTTRTITKPAKNGRPEVWVTFVRPGETSPLARR